MRRIKKSFINIFLFSFKIVMPKKLFKNVLGNDARANITKQYIAIFSVKNSIKKKRHTKTLIKKAKDEKKAGDNKFS